GWTEGVEAVVVTALPALASWLAADLEHRRSVATEKACGPGAVMVSALIRPRPHTGSVLLSKAQRLPIAARACPHRPPRDHRTSRRGNNRQHMLVQVRVDPDHVAQLVCKHPTDPPASFVGSGGAGLMQGKPRRQDC